MAAISLLFLVIFCILWSQNLSHAETDTLKQGQDFRDYDRLVSANGAFVLEFFDLLSSGPRFLGIQIISTKPHRSVWVANPKNPIPDSSGVLRVDNDGILKIAYRGGQPIALSSNPRKKTSESNLTVTLHDSGNLVMHEVDSNGVAGTLLWQSFDYPTNTLLPRMKLGIDLKTGKEWYLSSWLSDQAPSPGAFKLGLDPNGSHQLVIWQRGEVQWTSGVLENGSFNSLTEPSTGEYEYTFVTNDNERYFYYSLKRMFTISMWVLEPFGEFNQYFSGGSLDFPSEEIHHHISCSPDEVCQEQKPSECRNDSIRFVQIKGDINYENILYDEDNASLALTDCHAKCWNNCSCVAYKSSFENGTGCQFYTGDLKLDQYDNSDNIYVLIHEHGIDSAAQKNVMEVPSGKEPFLLPKISKGNNGSKKKWWWLWCIVAIAPALVLLLSGVLCYLRRRNKTGESETFQDKSLLALRSKITPSYKYSDANKLKNDSKNSQELLLFSFLQITTATNDFSPSSELGKGGFGPVYKGILPDGQQIAVKRLARSSGQGMVEFKNEITLIAELQHMNLVKLLGCCIEEEEKMLIYEYMPNKSLDSFLFDPIKREQLDWKTRFSIIEGISQGLLYLHKYSRLRVIHRDLKAGNILLDDEMNPKISDFGLARIFGQNEYEANTNRIVGTYGYMPPEYAMHGIFSVKSDVYSFGVLLLEIISGIRNTALSHTSGPLSLIEHAWNLWTRDASLELMDKSLDSSCPERQLLRCMHVGLLCVQECALDRPTMSDVTAMLTNETILLPYPNQPGFYVSRNGNGVALRNVKSDHCSACRVSITELEAR